MQYDEGRGFVPSLVIENEAGHSPMRGRTDDQEPWYWGKTLDNARQTCDRVNLQRYGISRKTQLRIVASSMRASNAGAPA
jgi:hypothetical protein